MNRDFVSASTIKRKALGPDDVARNVIVLTSGETERRSLPHLVAHLQKHGTFVDEVRTAPNGALNRRVSEKLIKAVWYENIHCPPQKIVLLVDVDGKPPGEVVDSLREQLDSSLPREIQVRLLYAYAQWHLEAWYFADAANLRGYLKRGLGSVDTSNPDKIQNPKLHLKQLLDPQVYTARVSEQIARALDAETIARISPSFKGFLQALLNGVAHG